ncbi:MAG: hypothetical protein MJY75_07710 [Bacteroidaceae bacterium]|nr:hypothetical protein [Bacteroidaceae bacterium]
MNRTAFLLLFCIRTVFAYAGNPLSHYAANAYRFDKEYPQEKVYLHFDNTSYLTGDTVWFKAYVVNASDLTASKSGVLYVDLLNAAGSEMKQQKFKIVDGQANGYISLTTNAKTETGRDWRGEIEGNLLSGYYEIRAYTAYMLNFQDAAVFSRVFPVMEITQDDTTGENVWKMPTYNLLKYHKRPLMTKTHDMDVAFYPEGGQLIIGQPCRVAFKVTGKDDLGLDATGVLDGVLDDSFHISTVHDGMGSFVFTPSGKRGRVKFETADGISGTFDLPEAVQYGHTLNIVGQTGDSLKLKVISSTDPAALQDSLGLAVMCRGRLLHFSTIPVQQAENTLDIDLSGIPEGVCQICLYDRTGSPVSTRMFYRRGNLDVPQIDVRFDKQAYHPLDKVRLDVDVTYKGQPFSDNICLSVRDDDGHQGPYYSDLRTDLLLSSDLRGLVWKPEYYFESDDTEHNEALDLLCMVQGWERYDWKQMSGTVEFNEKKRLESGLTYNAWVKDRKSGLGIDSIPLNVSYMLPDSSISEFKFITEQGGYMGLDIPDFYGDAEFSLWPGKMHGGRKTRKNCELFFDDELKPSARRLELQEMEKLWKQMVKAENPSDSTLELPQVINIKHGILLPNVDIEEKRMFVNYATFHDFDIHKDREGYNKMNITLWEYLNSQGLIIHDDKRNWFFAFPVFAHVSSVLDHKMSEIESLVVFDEPLDFETCNRIASKFMGQIVDFNAPYEPSEDEELIHLYLIAIENKHSKIIDTYNLENIRQLTLTAHGYTPPAQFYTPQYPDGPQYYDVDYRRTLYWIPNLQTDKNGHAGIEFYNNSYSTRFKVSASGLNGGVPYSMDK